MHVDTLKFYKYTPKIKPEYAGKFCNVPYSTLTIDQDGDVLLCGCQHHMPYAIGNIYKDTLQNIWLSESAKMVRESVDRGEFTYCNTSCNLLRSVKPRPELLPVLSNFPSVVRVDMDMSCNLKCPSCREDIIIEKHSAKIERQKLIYSELKQHALDNPTIDLTIAPINSGEIFASHSSLAFLRSLENYPHNNIKLYINTNGTLIKRNEKIVRAIKNGISLCRISIDAASPETYAKVRGGDWAELIQGLDLLKELEVPMMFRFCIQKHNYQEIEAFAEFAQKYGATSDFQRLQNWGHWNDTWWHDNNVFAEDHPTLNLITESIVRVQTKYNSSFV